MAVTLTLRNYFGAIGSPYNVRRRCEPLSSWLYDYGHPDLSLAVSQANSVADLVPHYRSVNGILCGWQNKFADLQTIASNPNYRGLQYAPMALHVPRDGHRMMVSDADEKKGFLRNRCEHYLKSGEGFKFFQDLELFIAKTDCRREYLARLDGYVLETVGFEDGLRGQILNPCEDALLTSNGSDVRKTLESVFCLLGLMRSGTGGMRSMAGDAAAKVADAFMEGVEHYLPDAPNSFRVLSRQWAKVNRFQLDDGDVQYFSRTAGIYSARILKSQFMLAKAMGLQPTTVERHMHHLNITEFIYAQGWLQGYVSHLRNQSDGEWIGVLGKNIHSTIAGALVKNDIRYAYLVARDFPTILENFRRDKAEVEATYGTQQVPKLFYDGTRLSQALLQGGAVKFLA